MEALEKFKKGEIGNSLEKVWGEEKKQLFCIL